jgi:class 3 adenylate cyclase
MEAEIRYVTTPDGVNLAFWSQGHGLATVYMPSFSPVGNLQFDWQMPRQRGLFEYLISQMNVTRYDARGRGLSDRDVADRSLDAHVGDLLTLLDRLSLERVALLARVYSGPVAISFARRYPERLSHLILFRTGARMADYCASPRMEALEALLEKDWELYTEVMARLAMGWPDNDLAARVAAQIRAQNTPEGARRTLDLIRSWDASALLTGIVTPTLVLHDMAAMVFSHEPSARMTAAGIPKAQLRILNGYTGETLGEAICQFVRGDRIAPVRQDTMPEGTAIILFADIVDSTALTEQLGDAVFRDRASRLDGAMRTGIRECGGTPVEGKVMGDGVMAVFSAARQAIDAAFRCRAAADGTGLSLHLGIHAGDVTREGANVYGGAVNVASRICDLSANDEILV